MMGLPPSTQERAYQLARDGAVMDIEALHVRLRREGYDPERLGAAVRPGLQMMLDRAAAKRGQAG